MNIPRDKARCAQEKGWLATCSPDVTNQASRIELTYSVYFLEFLFFLPVLGLEPKPLYMLGMIIV